MEGYPWLGHPQTCLGMMFPIPQKQEMVIQTELAVTVGAQKKTAKTTEAQTDLYNQGIHSIPSTG